MEAQAEEGAILVPPCVQQQGHQIKVRLLYGEGFPKLDSSGQVDCYIVAKIGNKTVKTSTVKTKGSSRQAIWKEDIFLPINLPNVTAQLELQIWDHDSIGKDDFIGTLYFRLQEIRS